MNTASGTTGPTYSLTTGQRVALDGPGEVIFLGVTKGKGVFKFLAHADVGIMRIKDEMPIHRAGGGSFDAKGEAVGFVC